MTETWKQINGYPNYQVSNLGRVRSYTEKFTGKKQGKPKIRKQQVSPYGYNILCLYNNGRKTHAVHRLVAEAFIPNPDNLRCINHKNGVKTDNRVDNIEWCTYSENIQHAYDTNLKQQHKGEAHSMAKLSKNDVLDIRNAYRLGCFNYSEIGRAYGVVYVTIRSIVNRKTWSHI